MICSIWTVNITLLKAQRQTLKCPAFSVTSLSQQCDHLETNVCNFYSSGHKKLPNPTYQVENCQRCRARSSVCVYLLQEQAPALNPGMDLKLANSSTPGDIPEFYLEWCAIVSRMVRSLTSSWLFK